MLFLLPVFLLAFANAAPGAIILGDVNHDDDINAQDVQLVINTVLGMDTGVDCDINRDKKTDAVDVQLVINAALGLQIGVKVPDLTGMTEGEASGALAFAYLTVGDVTSETSATVPAGQILSQRGQHLRIGPGFLQRSAIRGRAEYPSPLLQIDAEVLLVPGQSAFKIMNPSEVQIAPGFDGETPFSDLVEDDGGGPPVIVYRPQRGFLPHPG